jgi:Fe-S cluster assembly protein SufD
MIREKARQKSLDLEPPHPQQEPFHEIPASVLRLPPKSEPKGCPPIDSHRLAEWAHSLVFVDGDFSMELSNLPQNIVCLPLELALQSYGSFLHNRWAKVLQGEKDFFALHNAAEHGKGAFVYIPPKVNASLHILTILTQETLAIPRLEITLGKQAELTLVQTIVASHSKACMNSAIDFTLDAAAKVHFLDVNQFGAQMRAFCSMRVALKRDAALDMLSLTQGAALLRTTCSIELAEENSAVSLRSLAALNESRRAHFHVFVDHAAPNTTSNQHFKSILAGDSTSSFEGKIFVRPIAQKTVAYQLNNNLLLSDDAKAIAKPNLEIFADDVKASHGATVAQLSADELFYFRSRGLKEQDAKSLLAFGFCQEFIEAVQCDALRTSFAEAIRSVLEVPNAF